MDTNSKCMKCGVFTALCLADVIVSIILKGHYVRVVFTVCLCFLQVAKNDFFKINIF